MRDANVVSLSGIKSDHLYGTLIFSITSFLLSNSYFFLNLIEHQFAGSSNILIHADFHSNHRLNIRSHSNFKHATNFLLFQ